MAFAISISISMYVVSEYLIGISTVDWESWNGCDRINFLVLLEDMKKVDLLAVDLSWCKGALQF